MGLDGGTIPTRSDILRGQSWRLANSDSGAQRSTRGGQLTATGALHTAGVERRDRRQEAADGWAVCALACTTLPTRPAPGSIVACELGNLYLRDSVIEFLGKSGQFGSEHCDRSALNREFGHIERLKNVFPVVLEPAAPPATAGWCCPLDRAILTSGPHAFAAALPCGHVMREACLALCARSAAVGSGVRRARGGPRPIGLPGPYEGSGPTQPNVPHGWVLRWPHELAAGRPKVEDTPFNLQGATPRAPCAARRWRAL